MVTGDDLARNTVAVVLAGGKGTRLGPLTQHKCKPALPFGGAYQNIDFSLSNCVNSQIRRIGIATQYKPESLLRHVEKVRNKVVWRSGEYMAAWPAETRAPGTGYRGTADAVFRNLDFINRQRNRLVLVLAGDHVYQMDYRPMLEFHRRLQADVTVGCVEVDTELASQFGIVTADRGGRIEHFIEKPKSREGLPEGGHVLASMGIYVFDTAFLTRVLCRDAVSSRSQHDFGGDILPSLLRRSRVYAYRFAGRDGCESAYWRDVGTPAAYWQANLELLNDVPSLCLDDVSWPLPAVCGKPALTRCHARPGSEQGERSLIAEGCEIEGVVHRSVLFPGVRVSRGSSIEKSVVLPGATVGRNCRLSGVIVNSECRIPDGTVIDSSWRRLAEKDADEPIIVTAEDFASDPVNAYA